MSQKFMAKFSKSVLFTLALSATMVACKPGAESEKPPIHLNPNMDLQEKYKAQEESTFFEDGRTMRDPVEGTVARIELKNGKLAQENLRLDAHLYEGKDTNGNFTKAYPSLAKLGFADQHEMLKRGQARYNIYCAPCHDEAGAGSGMVVKRGAPVAANLTKTVRSVGDIYSYIKNGGPIMPSYALQIPVADRWAIVSYVQVLQDSVKPSKAELAANADSIAAKAKEEAAKLAQMTPAQKGKLAAVTCFACHSVKKGGEPTKMGPSWYGLLPKAGTVKHKVKIAGVEQEVEVTEDYIRESVRNPAAKIALATSGMFKGQYFAGMPAMSKEALSEEQLEAIIAYMKTLNDQ